MARTYSIRTVLMLMMVGEIILAIGITGWLWYDNGNASVRSLTIDRCKEISARVESQIETLLATARNAAGAQIDFIKTDLVGLSSSGNRQRLLDYQMSFLRRHPYLTSIGLGITDGQLAAAQRDPDNTLKELYSDAGEDILYEKNLGEDVVESTPFVTTARPWFLKANEKRRPGWTEVYKFAGSPPQLGVSAFDLVTDDDSEIIAITICDITLGPVDEFLNQLYLTENGRSAVLDRNGLLIAISQGRSLNEDEEGNLIRVTAKSCDDQLIKETVLTLEQDLGDISEWPMAGSREITTQIGTVLLVWQTIRSQQDIDWISLIAIPSVDLIAGISERTRWTGIAFLLLILLTIPIVWRTAGGITRPVRELNIEMKQIARFEIEGTSGKPSRLTELNQMQNRMEGMRHALASFEKYVPSRVVRQLVTEDRVAVPGMEEATSCIYFSDVVGFTTIAETLPPEQMVMLAGEYLQEMSHQVLEHSGIIDKFIGDAIMAFWIAEVDGTRVTARACQAALKSQKRLEELRSDWKKRDLPQLRARIGLHTGPVLVGNIGSQNRLNYTVLGDTVNLASRLEGLNRIYGTEIIVSAEVAQIVADEMHCRILDHVAVKGRRAGGAIYQLVCEQDQATDSQQTIAYLHAEALEKYEAGNFEDAASAFEEMHREFPDDSPAGILADRCKELIKHPPENWAGFTLLDKTIQDS
ncbi:MAG: adenylate/guanylate cyclase domain-containing protein [Planctomycetota bacterium]